MKETRIAFQIGYLGTNFFGSQYQPDVRTVDGEIFAACKRASLITDRQSSHFSLSGRTDRGVHAKFQILAFNTAFPDRAVRAINGQLPPDIWADKYAIVNDNFSPRYDVCERTYRYYYKENPGNSDLIHKAVKCFIGEHDFSCFARIEEGRSPIRTIKSITIDENDGHVLLEITANSFLWHMVRCIAGTLSDVGNGIISEERVKAMISGNCKNKAKPVDPDGLILWNMKTAKILNWQSIKRVNRTEKYLLEKLNSYRLMAEICQNLI